MLTSVLVYQTFLPSVCNTWFSCIRSNLPHQIPAQKPWPPLSLPAMTHLSCFQPVAFAQRAVAQISPSSCLRSNSELRQTVPSYCRSQPPFSWETSPWLSKPISSVPSGKEVVSGRLPPQTKAHTPTFTLPSWLLPNHNAVNVHVSLSFIKWPVPWRQRLNHKL